MSTVIVVVAINSSGDVALCTSGCVDDVMFSHCHNGFYGVFLGGDSATVESTTSIQTNFFNDNDQLVHIAGYAQGRGLLYVIAFVKR